MNDHRPDALSQLATTFRLRGSLSGSFSHAAPFGLAMPKSEHAVLLVVTRGRVHFEIDGEPRQRLELSPGDVVALPHGHAYALRDDPGTPLRPMVQSECGTSPAKGAQAEFLAMCCELAGGRANPLLRVLPPLIHCPGSEGHVARWLEPTVRLLASESAGTAPGRATILDRLAEVVFIQLIRAWLEGLPAGEGGWLRALRDPQLAAALEAITRSRAVRGPWSRWLRWAHMSRSAFAGRFKSLVGEPARVRDNAGAFSARAAAGRRRAAQAHRRDLGLRVRGGVPHRVQAVDWRITRDYRARARAQRRHRPAHDRELSESRHAQRNLKRLAPRRI
jgi:hypothetical protein